MDDQTRYGITKIHEEYLESHKEKGELIEQYGMLRDLIRIKCTPIYYSLSLLDRILNANFIAKTLVEGKDILVDLNYL